MKKAENPQDVRQLSIKLNVNAQELAKLQKAADRAQLRLSTFIRAEMLKLINK